MTFIIFMAFGAVVGWLLAQNRRGSLHGAVTDMAIGAVGGLIGGWAIGETGLAGVTGLLASLIAAIALAIGLIRTVRTVAPAADL